ncbi:zinc finger domain-containing protein [Ophiocordyceps sinensis CO18]|uniref:Zinc finger domain-containing protein n=1 Tax=Ophiocordyceps sinensis (strain Co18 / CGMCC 3.14243) TaxID=911162 RepID=T5AIV8_OPHSC|nr:zinc finger domain-containing protein [Ophiocordyceps sinensis CO18]
MPSASRTSGRGTPRSRFKRFLNSLLRDGSLRRDRNVQEVQDLTYEGRDGSLRRYRRLSRNHDISGVQDLTYGPRLWDPLGHFPLRTASGGTVRLESDSSKSSLPNQDVETQVGGSSRSLRSSRGRQRISEWKSAKTEVEDPDAITPAPLVETQVSDATATTPTPLPSLQDRRDQLQSSELKSAETLVEDPDAITPAPLVETQVSDATATAPTLRPSSLQERRDRLQSSAWKSAETQVEDPDAITPAPLVETQVSDVTVTAPTPRPSFLLDRWNRLRRKRLQPVVEMKLGPSFSFCSTIPEVVELPDDYRCHVCGSIIGRPRSRDGKVEKPVFLPCGKAYGHECLFRTYNNKAQSTHCPDCLAPMRHACGHLALPTTTPPVATNEKAAVTLRNYEFCKSPRGLWLHTTIRRRTDRLQRAEAMQAEHEKSGMNLAYAAVRKVHRRHAAMAKLLLFQEHKIWWAKQRASFAVRP